MSRLLNTFSQKYWTKTLVQSAMHCALYIPSLENINTQKGRKNAAKSYNLKIFSVYILLLLFCLLLLFFIFIIKMVKKYYLQTNTTIFTNYIEFGFLFEIWPSNWCRHEIRHRQWERVQVQLVPAYNHLLNTRAVRFRIIW